MSTSPFKTSILQFIFVNNKIKLDVNVKKVELKIGKIIINKYSNNIFFVLS